MDQAPLSETEQRALLERIRPSRVLVATPCGGASVKMQYATSLLRTVSMFAQAGIALDVMMTASACVDRDRNRIVARFMESDFTHLLFIDSDQTWEPPTVLRLLAMDHDFVGVPVHKKTHKSVFNCNYLDTKRVPIERGAMEVAEIGTGFLMLRRAVFEKMMASYPELHIPACKEEPTVSPFYFALFANAIEDGRYTSEDLTFCRRWRKLGGRIWADFRSEVGHIGDYDYRGRLADALVIEE